MYHVRAANISICAMMLEQVLNVQRIDWEFDSRATLLTHAASCVRIGTDKLMGTKYQYVGVWSRFALCAVTPDDTQNAYIVSLLQQLGIRTWEDLVDMSTGLLCMDGLLSRDA